MLGTVIALAPRVVALTLLADRFWKLVRSPSILNGVGLVVAIVLVVLTSRVLRQLAGAEERARG